VPAAVSPRIVPEIIATVHDGKASGMGRVRRPAMMIELMVPGARRSMSLQNVSKSIGFALLCCPCR
jgi:hypothetical protein